MTEREKAEHWLAERMRAAYQSGVAEWVNAPVGSLPEYETAWSVPEAMGWERVTGIAADAIERVAMTRCEHCHNVRISPLPWAEAIPRDTTPE